MLYVDRLDAPHRGGAELQALRSLSHMLGPAVWLNTIVAFTHAGGWACGQGPSTSHCSLHAGGDRNGAGMSALRRPPLQVERDLTIQAVAQAVHASL